MAEAKPRLSEDWLAVWGGLLIFALSLGVLAGVDLLGWGVKTQVWVQLANALVPVSKTYGKLPGVLSLLATYVFLLLATALGAKALRLPIGAVRPRVHGDLLDQLCVLDRGELCLHRGHAGQAEELSASLGR